MTLQFDPTQTVRFPAPMLGTGFPIGGPLTDAALTHAAALWQRGSAELEASTIHWEHVVRTFIERGSDVDAVTARRLLCQ